MVERLVQRLTRLAAAFPRDNATEATLAVYAEELYQLEPEALLTAIDNVTRSARRFPPLSEILQEYHEEREREWERMRRAEHQPALPIARAPMPDHVREELRKLGLIFDRRAQELEAE